MAFPEDILDIRVDLNIGGTWTTISDTGDVRAEQGITIQRGRRASAGEVEYGRCSLTLSNRDGKYSPRNPRSPYYGLIGRNTPIRVSVMTGEPYLSLDGDTANYASTPDTSALDITGDLDLRAEATINWQDPDTNQVLISKWETTGNQRSYSLKVYQNQLTLNWSSDGTSSLFASQTTPSLRGRAAVRATLDVDNGSGVYEVKMYTAESLDGPWTQLGATLTGSSTTSVFSSTAPLKVAGEDPTTSPPRSPFIGRGHRFEVRSGIDGTEVANPDFTAQTIGDTSFVDDAGLTWTLAGDTEITNRQTRFYGEVSEWPPEWETGGHDVTVPIEASGPLRRYRQGTSPLDSTLRRRIPSDPDVLAYWPMEEGAGATRAYSPIPDVRPMIASGLTFAADDTLAGSNPLPTMATGSSFSGKVPHGTGAGWQVEFVYKLDTAPPTAANLINVYLSGSPARIVRVRPSAASIVIDVLNADGTVLASDTGSGTLSLPAFFGQWNTLRIRGVPNGANTDIFAAWFPISDPLGWALGPATYTGAVGNVSAVGNFGPSALDGMPIGHIAVFDTDNTSIFNGADDAFDGDSALGRMSRVAGEEGFPLVLYDGDLSTDSERVGPQHPDTTLSVVQSAADVDGGILYESRESLDLVYRDRASLYNQTAAMTVDYGGGGGLVTPLRPTDDDQSLVNDVTVTREGGSSGRAVLETGPLSIQAPPDGVGRYDTSLALNLHTDSQATQHAAWRMHLGTWDEARYPTVRLNLANAPSIIPDAIGVDIGDRIQITNPPSWLPPETIDLIAQGYTETLSQYEWLIEYNCTPAGPWTVAVTDDDTLGRADTAGSELVAAATDDDTALAVTTTSGPRWTTDPADFPFDLMVGGERVTATAIGSPLLDTFTRTSTPTVTDTFTRTTSNGWGSADTGQAWTTSGGTAADYATNGTKGTHSVGVVNSSRFTTLGSISLADLDMQADITVPVAATGASISTGLRLRSADTSNYYYIETKRTAGGNFTLELVSRVAAVSTTIAGPVTVGAVAAGDTWTVRARLVGSVLQAKAWKTSGSEPEAWAVEAVTTTLTAAGPVGTRSILSTGNTNTLPVVVTWDNIRVTEVVQGWGIGTSGEAWTTAGGSASEYSADDGHGVMALTTVNTSRRAVTGPGWVDTDIQAAFTVPAVAVTDSIDIGLMSRYADGSNYYLGVLHFHDDATVDVRIRKNVAGTFTTLDIGDSIGSYAAGDVFWLRLSTTGGEVRARGWADGAAEPDTWHATATDTSHTAAGQVGVRANLQVSNTNTLPVVIRADDFEVVSPQRFTVTRSVNGISKSHTAGTDVRLAQPAHAAL